MPPPPPPPPPPPKAPPPPSAPPKTAERGALLNSIQKGTKLKKAQTNDRSAPVTTAPKPTPGGGGGMPMPGGGGMPRPGGGGASSAGPQLGGLFAGGMPQLKPGGGTLKKSTPPPMVQPVAVPLPSTGGFKPPMKTAPPPMAKPQPPPPMAKPQPPPPMMKPQPPMMSKPTPPPPMSKPNPPPPMNRPPPPPSRVSVQPQSNNDEELRNALDQISNLEAQLRESQQRIRQLEGDLDKAKKTSMAVPPKKSATALYDYTSEEFGDLCFKAGEVINIIKVDGDWSVGEKAGNFPTAFVQFK